MHYERPHCLYRTLPDDHVLIAPEERERKNEEKGSITHLHTTRKRARGRTGQPKPRDSKVFLSFFLKLLSIRPRDPKKRMMMRASALRRLIYPFSSGDSEIPGSHTQALFIHTHTLHALSPSSERNPGDLMWVICRRTGHGVSVWRFLAAIMPRT
jgi:hypothetical protein